MSVMETLNTRRTYRRFAQKPVPQDVVDDMVEALRLSSCGANRQAVKLVVVQSPEMVAKVHPLVKWAAYLPPEQGTPKADEQPVMYLAVVQDSSIPGDLNTDTGIALANITLAAWAKGVGSCIMGAINKPALSELLGIAAPDKLAFMDGLEATISEFPISLDIARAARARGMHTIAGAPNVMLGHSHSGNLSAREAVQAGAIDVLCSDYYPAALLDAVFTLRDQCGLDIAKAFALVTINPAKAAGIADEVGSIAVGKRADVLLVREISCGEGEGSGEHPVAGPDGRVARTMPVVTRAFVGGRSVFRSHYPDQPCGYGRDTEQLVSLDQLTRPLAKAV